MRALSSSDTNTRKVLTALNGCEMTPAQLVEATGIEVRRVNRICASLKHRGFIKRTDGNGERPGAVWAQGGALPVVLKGQFWTDAKMALLTEYAAKGLSGAEIANRLGDGCTRNMAIGMAGRNGIIINSLGERGMSVAQMHRTIRQRAKAPPKPKPTPKPKVAKMAPEPYAPVGVKLTHLTSRMCRYGLDDPGPGRMDELTFCGARTVEGQTYCAHHFRICHWHGVGNQPVTAEAFLRRGQKAAA